MPAAPASELSKVALIIRQAYHINMSVSNQYESLIIPASRGPRARTFRIVMDAAVRLSQSGTIPSVSDVAEAAEVSRATAYRYFPTQSALVEAVVYEALGPILEWRSDSDDVEQRVSELFAFAYPRMQSKQTSLCASLAVALERRARNLPAPRSRATRRILLSKALQPLERKFAKPELLRLAQALSLVFGIESIVVLSDVWRFEGEKAADVIKWAADALVRTALAEFAAKKNSADKGATPDGGRPRR